MVSYQYNHLTGHWQVASVAGEGYFVPALPGDPPAKLEVPANVGKII
jgi:hypothetical protein